LEEVNNQFNRDTKEKKVMWQDIVIRELAVFVNISVEAAGVNFLVHT